ncbi:unnamed protein product [Phytophthora fragariaefolia]|uniref:Unnamed protein product n=1 Tax=Phytophthora fragariaefolia TaxID=1490495 RepID=A0A9W6YQD5_9STRA|nr:unnamed protein product [Phytophthora fragariaefolia]
MSLLSHRLSHRPFCNRYYRGSRKSLPTQRQHGHFISTNGTHRCAAEANPKAKATMDLITEMPPARPSFVGGTLDEALGSMDAEENGE